MKRILTSLCTIIAIAAFSQSALSQETDQTQTPATDKKQGYCQFQDFQNHVYCNEGDIILFQPAQWGNDQLPLLAIYFLCNPDQPIHFNRASVVCTYQKKTDDQFKDADNLARMAAEQQQQNQQ
ncbi:MAG: hypothetical protein LUC43_06645 [Burkholderiales bacterium]|nr:hypothetical protein [Burkholderiales bacterium]